MIQDASILDPNVIDFLIHVVNQLDPASFVKFARSCRDLQNFCFNARGIRVPFGSRDHGKTFNLLVHKDRHGTHAELEEDRFLLPRPFPEEQLERLLKMPFRLEIETAVIWDESGEDQYRTVTEAREFLQRFSRPRIHSVSLSLNTIDWIAFAQFIQEFRVERLELTRFGITPVPPDVFAFITNNLSFFVYFDFVSDEAVLSANADELHLGGARISTETFKKLVKKFLASNFTHWTVGRERQPRNNDNSSLEETPDPFIDACQEALKTIKSNEAVDWAEMEPCVLYWTARNRFIFRFVRENGSRGRIHIMPFLIIFTID